MLFNDLVDNQTSQNFTSTSTKFVQAIVFLSDVNTILTHILSKVDNCGWMLLHTSSAGRWGWGLGYTLWKQNDTVLLKVCVVINFSLHLQYLLVL